MEDNIIKVDNSEILFPFEVNGKTYCALVDKESSENAVYFALKTDIDENNCVLTSIPDTDIDMVVSEYDKLIAFFESEDELDVEEEII